MTDHGPNPTDPPTAAGPPPHDRAAPTTTSSAVSRRRFLGLAGGGLLVGAAAAGGAVTVDRLLSATRGDASSFSPDGPAVDTGVILVAVQLEGGLDFLDTVIPINSSRYQQLRRDSGVDLGAALPIDDRFALHPSLPGLAQRWSNGELAMVHGVGYPNSSLSHFVDTEVWERGNGDVGDPTGWLGRTLDAYAGAEGDPLLGISVGTLSPSMYGPNWNPVALSEEGRLPWTPSFVERYPELVRAYGEMVTAAPAGPTAATGADLAERVRASQSLVRDVADTVGGATDIEALGRTMELLEESETDEGGVGDGGGILAQRLGIVADLIKGGLPTRAYHVAHGGDFDTHADQVASLPGLLASLDEGLRSFDAALGPMRERVVVATWSEFGRRPDWNGSGTDHGTAGTQLVLGPRVAGGHYGEPASLDRFDDEDNFIITSDYRSYLGGLAQGALGVESARVVGEEHTPLELLT